MVKYSLKQSEYSKYKKEQINFDHIITIALIVITVILFTAMQLTAQVKVKKDVVKNRNIKKNNTQTTTTPNSTQATGDVVNVKDDAGNTLMTVTDEGSAGSIKLNDAGAVTPNTNKLYNNGGSLYWNGSALSGGSATEINDLSDGTTGNFSVFLGANAGSNSIGFGNTAVGHSAMDASTSSATENVAFGNSALSKNSSGKFNTAIGQAALKLLVNGNNNTAVGEDALYNNKSGSGNVALGMEAGRNETGSNKLYINNDSSSSPLIWGDFANDSIKINGEFHVTNNTIFDGKVGIGTTNPIDKVTIVAAASGQDGLRVKIGGGTKFKVVENGGVAIGTNYSSTPTNGLYVHGKTKLTSLQVTGGAVNGYVLTSDANGNATWQVSSGGGAAAINDLNDGKTTATSLYLGSTAGEYDDGGSNSNTGLGIGSLMSESISGSNGQRNSAVGYFSLNANNSGQSNTANGYYALSGNTNGDFNTAVGRSTLGLNTTGQRNVAVGAWANLNNNTGSNNTMIGYEAGRGTGTTGRPVSGNIFIGYQAGANETTDNKLFIENSNSSTPLIWGDFATDSIKINGNLNVSGNITMDITYSVGDYAQGGYVFEVTPNGKHGLVVTLQDQMAGGGGSGASFDGAINECSKESKHTADGANYKDWRIPTNREWQVIYSNKSAIDAMANSHGGTPFNSTLNLYWTTQIQPQNTAYAYYINMDTGTLYSTGRGGLHSVRCVRAF